MARKILLADDSVTAQNMGRKILADAGYEVITVNNGSAALKKIAETKPDLIVLDVYMPGYSGLEVCQRLKESQETSRLPILLTVGKLEPFKPEEAKRVRADGFIVKPFEASELLSALSKLEDKVVPRSEASKPGRFARATAAIEEGRFDRTVAIEEDSGWKSRIRFPSKKKSKSDEEEENDTVNSASAKDVRPVVEFKPTHPPLEEKKEDARVDLGALAPEGLPKDVTAEEIAALAAAAAQVKGKMAETRVANSAPVESASAESRAVGNATVEAAVVAQPKPGPHSHEQTQPAAETAQKPEPAVASAGPVAASAEPKAEGKEEKYEALADKLSEASPTGSAPGQADTIAAAANLGHDSGRSSPISVSEVSSGNGSWSHGQPDRRSDEPVTMAMGAAAGADSGGSRSRWTAVSVSVAADEAAISLEHEMHKAYAAFAAADMGHAALIAAPETQPAVAEPTAAMQTSVPVEAAKPVAEVPATPAPETTHTLSAVVGAATEAVTAAVEGLKAVAASYFEEKPAEQREQEAASVQPPEAIAEPAPEALPVVEARSEETPVADSRASEPEKAKEEAPQSFPENSTDKEQEAEVPTAVIEAVTPSAEETPTTAETVPSAVVDEVQPEHIASHSSTSEAVAPLEPATPATAESMGDSDAAVNTAAAWASWRRIRESGESPHDTAAMAAAAGAETAPAEIPSAPEQESGEIASIVDSVLADLRPKIVAEISRKLGKKK